MCLIFDLKSQRILDDSILKWFDFLEQVQQLHSVVALLEKSIPELSQFQSTLPEKRSQLDQIKVRVVFFNLGYLNPI